MAYLKGPLGWLVIAVAGCGAIALALLPPRGAAPDGRPTRSGVLTGAPSAERLRANEIAKQWRQAALHLRLHEWRLRLAPELNRLRAADAPTLVTAIDTLWPRDVRERAASAITAAWRALEIGTTKIGVAVVVEPEPVPAGVPSRTSSAYLLPDSLDRTTCVAWVAPAAVTRVTLERAGEQYARALSGWARRLLGPCAFYASFGRPSVAVERWLAARQHRFAQSASWDSLTIRQDLPWYDARPDTRADRAEWARWAYGQLPAMVLGCMAERTSACRDAVGGGVPASGTVPRFVARSGDVVTDLPGSTMLLAEMIGAFGRARFGRFWISDLPPDSAFHLAMDTTLDDWVRSRQRAYGTTLVAGPTPSWVAGAVSIGLAALGLAFAMAAAARRQIG